MKDIPATSELPLVQVREALDRILASPEFERSGRLCDFLRYVIEEELAGRGDTIRGKTIAQDVYGRSPHDGGDPENVVRVDARRLRQQLEHYYDSAGKSEDIRINMDLGTYRPRFEMQPSGIGVGTKRPMFHLAGLAGLFAIGALAGVGATLLLTSRDSGQFASGIPPGLSIHETQSWSSTTAQRKAIFEKSPASLEAISLADQAQLMLFPIFDLPRQELMTRVFEQVIDLDPDYFAGHAGLAHNLSVRAILSPHGDTRTSLLSRAAVSAEEARRLAPAEPKTQIALAYVAFATGDHVEAMRLAELAASLAPEDGRILDSLGAIALFSGNFERAIDVSNNGLAREGSNQRFANRNIYAAANFHLGNYRESFETFEEAASFGDPLSAPSLAYQAAALVAFGEKEAARRKLDELRRAWPDTPLEQMLYNVHSEKENADAVLSRLHEIGWPSDG